MDRVGIKLDASMREMLVDFAGTNTPQRAEFIMERRIRTYSSRARTNGAAVVPTTVVMTIKTLGGRRRSLVSTVSSVMESFWTLSSEDCCRFSDTSHRRPCSYIENQ